MKRHSSFHNHILTSIFAAFFAIPAAAETPAGGETLDEMFTQLQNAENAASAERIERRIDREWSKSGSAAMDLLLQRGRDALEAGDAEAAIEHFTALIDHAPDFAEGWNDRAIAYFQAGQFGPAVADIQQTLLRNPRHFGAMVGFAQILEETEQPEQALKVYKAVQAIHPYLAGVSEAVERLEIQSSGQEM